MRSPRLVGLLLLLPLSAGCAFGQGQSTAPASAPAASADPVALAGFSESERERIVAVAPVVESAAAERALDPSLLYAIIWVESRFDPNAQSPAGARGLMQLMPATAAALAKQMGEPRPRASDPQFNVRAGSLYLSAMIEKFGDESTALAAYHAGPGNVAKWKAAGKPFPDWSDDYVEAVMAARERFRGVEHGGTASPALASAAVEVEAAPDPASLPDATEVHRLAAAGQLEDVVEPSADPLEFEPVFEPHPEADANPQAGPPPGWPGRAPASDPEPPLVAAKQAPMPVPEETAAVGLLPDL